MNPCYVFMVCNRTPLPLLCFPTLGTSCLCLQAQTYKIPLKTLWKVNWENTFLFTFMKSWQVGCFSLILL